MKVNWKKILKISVIVCIAAAALIALWYLALMPLIRRYIIEEVLRTVPPLHSIQAQ